MAIIGVLKSDSSPMVSLVPSTASKLIKDGFDILLEKHAGESSHFSDHEYNGVQFVDKKEICEKSDIFLHLESNLNDPQLAQLKEGAIVIGRYGFNEEPPLYKNVPIFNLDRVPRSSIAQSMDVLSSLASLSGYKAVLEASNHFPGYFPMMTTAAGTVPPAKVLVLGAGVAGLQAIATARRLGAVVEAFDVRSAVREEVESLGAKFVEVEGGKEDHAAGGYAVEQSDEYKARQSAMIQDRAIKSDIVITTANIPGRTAPVLIQKSTVERMKAGSIVVDMATATGGNCEGSKDQEWVQIGDVRVLGDAALYKKLPKEASRLYATNLYNFLKFIWKEDGKSMPWDHEIVQNTLLTKSKPAEAPVA